jgi:diguanylate cyclase (GGDEF)-like protein
MGDLIKMKNKYTILGLISLSIIIPIILRFNMSSIYPYFWTSFIVPAILVPNWRASSFILITLTGVEFGIEYYLHAGVLTVDLALALLGGTSAAFLVFFVFTYIHNQNKRIIKNLQKQTVTDPLTGAYNRRYLDVYMKKAANMQSTEESFLLIIDVDYFKKLNDMYGNLFADEVLKQVAGLIQRNLQESDILIRMGGEEFIVVLANNRKAHASFVANRIQTMVRDTRFVHQDQSVFVTISVGMSTFTYGKPMEQFIEKADEALYQAKISGRNRVVFAS